jgi:hypothetical protein
VVIAFSGAESLKILGLSNTFFPATSGIEAASQISFMLLSRSASE